MVCLSHFRILFSKAAQVRSATLKYINNNKYCHNLIS